MNKKLIDLQRGENLRIMAEWIPGVKRTSVEMQCILCDRWVPMTMGGVCRGCDDTPENIRTRLSEKYGARPDATAPAWHPTLSREIL